MKHFAIIYDSKTGTTKQAADWIAEGMQTAGDVDAKCFSSQMPTWRSSVTRTV